MFNIPSNNKRQTVILDCNNKYIRGTLVKKSFRGINYNQFIKYYNKTKNIYMMYNIDIKTT